MSGDVIILGGNGRFGRAAIDAFHHAGWRVRSFVRTPWLDHGHGAGRLIIGDAFDRDAVIKAARGCEVIVNALNPPYPRWRQDLPRLTQTVIAAARAATAAGATVMLPGNVYNYGAGMPEHLHETTPHAPTTRKG